MRTLPHRVGVGQVVEVDRRLERLRLPNLNSLPTRTSILVERVDARVAERLEVDRSGRSPNRQRAADLPGERRSLLRR